MPEEVRNWAKALDAELARQFPTLELVRAQVLAPVQEP